MKLTDEPLLLQKCINALLLTAGGLIAFYVIFYLLKRWSKSKTYTLPTLIDKHLHLSGVALFLVITLNINISVFQRYFSENAFGNIQHALQILLILSVSFLLIKLIALFRDVMINYHRKQEYKDYRLRSVRTKFQLIQRVINIVIIIATISAVLMTFQQVQKIGTTLLASAGVAGIVLGFAAQKSLSTLFAGIQIAISQPVKIDDTVVVEGQFGTIGEITLTYVVLNTWDEKRLIVPINYFLEKPFENWTRNSPEVIGKVKMYADYTLPIETVRSEFLSWLKASPLWDGRKAALRVTNADDKAIELRATMSARNSDDAFDLESFIREKMITYIRENYPESLPTSRLNIKNTLANGSSTKPQNSFI